MPKSQRWCVSARNTNITNQSSQPNQQTDRPARQPSNQSLCQLGSQSFSYRGILQSQWVNLSAALTLLFDLLFDFCYSTKYWHFIIVNEISNLAHAHTQTHTRTETHCNSFICIGPTLVCVCVYVYEHNNMFILQIDLCWHRKLRVMFNCNC